MCFIKEIIPVYKGGECLLPGTSWNFKYSSVSTAEVRIQSQVMPCEICSVQSVIWTVVCTSTSVFLCLYFTAASYILLLAGQMSKVWELSKNNNAVLESGEHWIKNSNFTFFWQSYSTNAPYSSSPQNLSYQKNKMARPGKSGRIDYKNTDNDWGVCGWPWQLFALGKANCPLFVDSNRSISVKNILGLNAVVFLCVYINTVLFFLCG
jgi:hypothetical protein